MAAPLLFPHVPEWGGLGAAPFSGIGSHGARRAEHRRARAGDLLRATFAARGRSMHRRGP
eukprot:scaffold33730_cov33-Phaeocystis_antarctica.AAC.1